MIYCDIYRYLSISVYDLNLFKKFKQTILYVFLGIKDSNEHMVKLIEHTWQEFEIETEISIEDLLLVYWRLIVIIQETKCRLPIHWFLRYIKRFSRILYLRQKKLTGLDSFIIANHQRKVLLNVHSGIPRLFSIVFFLCSCVKDLWYLYLLCNDPSVSLLIGMSFALERSLSW